jgi:hypothetical protein
MTCYEGVAEDPAKYSTHGWNMADDAASVESCKRLLEIWVDGIIYYVLYG